MSVWRPRKDRGNSRDYFETADVRIGPRPHTIRPQPSPQPSYRHPLSPLPCLIERVRTRNGWLRRSRSHLAPADEKMADAPDASKDDEDGVVV